jgi:large subunit ribosomal protein L24
MVTKHVRASQTGPGGIEQKEAPLHISNVAHIDPETSKSTRVGFDVKDGVKTRIARRSGKAIG